MPGKDIAILKIDGDSSLPILNIAQDSLPLVGELLFVYGFPSRPYPTESMIADVIGSAERVYYRSYGRNATKR